MIGYSQAIKTIERPSTCSKPKTSTGNCNAHDLYEKTAKTQQLLRHTLRALSSWVGDALLAKPVRFSAL